MAQRTHTYNIEAGTRQFKGTVELTGAITVADQTGSQGQTATQTTAVTTFLTAVKTLDTALGSVRNIHINVSK